MVSHAVAPRRAREAKILAHRYLCKRAARRFLRNGLERDDLEQVAAIGLVKATDRFDPSTETPFEAFAWIMIVGELGHHVRDHEFPIRPPRALRALERRHAAAWERLAQRNDREPNDREIAAELDAPFAAVRELRVVRACGTPLNVEDPGVAPELDDRVAANFGNAVEGIVLRGALDALALHERLVLYGVYWLELSRTEIGRRLGVSAKVVARLQRNALERLRGLCDTEFLPT